MLGAVMFAHRSMQPVIEAIIKLAEQAAKEPWELAPAADKAAIKAQAQGAHRQGHRGRLQADRQAGALRPRSPPPRQGRRGVRREPTRRSSSSPASWSRVIEADVVRGAILKEGRRIDGRDTKTVRPIEAIVGFLPRTHGSALFTRGETQAIVSTTLGTKESEQMIDGLEGLSYQRFMLHYNFPPYSVGEVGRFGAPSAARDRPRQARLARAAPDAPEHRGVPVHDPRPLRHHRVQRLDRRWRRCAAEASR